MRFTKQVLFTFPIILVAVILTACESSVKTPEQTIGNYNELARSRLEFIRKHTTYVYDSETKMCLMSLYYIKSPLLYSAYGSVASIPCLNVVDKLLSEHRTHYLADAGKHLDQVR